MVSVDPELPDSDGALPAPERNVPRSAPGDPKRLPCGMSRLFAFACGAAIIAGAASWLIGERVVHAYKNDLFPLSKFMPTAEEMRRLREARIYAATFNFAALGATLGLAMGLAGGLARRSAWSGARAAILGLVLAAAAAAALSLVLVPNFFKKHDPQSNELTLPLLTHGTIWTPVGAITGLVFGIGLGGRGRWKATLLGGFVGAAAATVVYEVVGALAFATYKTDLPLSSSSTTRGMALGLVAIFSAVGAVSALHEAAKSKAPSSVPS